MEHHLVVEIEIHNRHFTCGSDVNETMTQNRFTVICNEDNMVGAAKNIFVPSLWNSTFKLNHLSSLLTKLLFQSIFVHPFL